MNLLTATFDSLWLVFRNLFRKPTTIEFPAERRQRAERFRASFALTHDEHGEENCIGCMQCENICPSKVITVIKAPKRVSPVTGKKRGYCTDFTLDLQACIICELCVQVCPTDSIIMTQVQESPATSREELVLTMAKLYANETAKPAAWSNGSILMEMQDPKRGQPKPVKKPVAKKPVAKKPVVKPAAAPEKPVAAAAPEKPVAAPEKPAAAAAPEKPAAAAAPEKPVAAPEEPAAAAVPEEPAAAPEKPSKEAPKDD